MSDEVVVKIAALSKHIPSYCKEQEALEIFYNGKDGIVITLPPKGSQIIDFKTECHISVPDGYEMHITGSLPLLEQKVFVFGQPLILSSGVYENLEIPLIQYGFRGFEIEHGDPIALGRLYKHTKLTVEESELSSMKG